MAQRPRINIEAPAEVNNLLMRMAAEESRVEGRRVSMKEVLLEAIEHYRQDKHPEVER